MSDDKKTGENKKTATIKIDGEEVIVNKLKAGKFYEAQECIAELLGSAMKAVPIKSDTETDRENNKGVGNSQAYVDLFKEYPNHIVKFVSICTGMAEEELKDKAYPEEITDAFAVCLELNDVMENLKNSAAPMQILGGKAE